MTADTTPAVRIAEALSLHPEVMVVERDDPTAELSLSSLTDTINEALAAAPVAPAGEGELDQTVTEVAVSTIRWAIGRGDDLRDYKEPLEHVLIAALRSRSSPDLSGGGPLDTLADWLVMREQQSMDAAQQHVEKAPAKHFCAGKVSAFREVASVLWNSPEWFAALSPSREGVEPEAGAVAWRYRLIDKRGPGRWNLVYTEARAREPWAGLDREVQPLYTHPTPADDRLAVAVEALKVADQHIQHMAAWITRTNASDTPLHGYSFEALGEDKWIIDQALGRTGDREAAR